MGIYLNPSIRSFSMAYNSEIYVDKTGLISYTNSVLCTSQRFLSVSRPRRFGKSYAADMLCAYYGQTESRDIFGKCRISKYDNWDKYLGKFDVIRLVMTKFFKSNVTASDALSKMQKLVCKEICSANPDVEYEDKENLIQVIEDVYSATDKQFVIIIDEWDAIFRERKDDKEGQILYLDFLRDWLKDNDYIALAYMTGILPIKKYGKHSALNMFDEYSMITPMQLAEYTGFTESEVQELCKKYDMSFDEVSDWYDGYLISNSVPIEKRKLYRSGEYTEYRFPIYNPLSVVKAMRTGVIDDYWSKTESYEALADLIAMNYDGLKDDIAIMMDGGSVKVNISSYQNDMTSFNNKDDVLTLLIHLGYLCYDNVEKTVFIPNKEIIEEFNTSTKGDNWIGTFKSFQISNELISAIWSLNEEKTAELIELAHDRAGNKTYNDEAALSYGIQYALYAAQKYYTTIQELDSGKGYADLVYLPSPRYPDKPALLMELKYNKDVQTAADQVRARNYPQVLEHYAGNLLVVSINYDKDANGESYKKHSCKIEKL
ncbi:MAG: AAA family ATPase [Eubacterium sp.]|nr:AAA family ATPase [Eubacterium sp.]